MTANDTLCFADFDPVTGAPTVDGFTGNEDAGVTTLEREPGYVLGSRLNYDGGSGGLPQVIFQGVKNGTNLNMAFFCRFDKSFDTKDVIVIALKPNQGDPLSAARRIDIFPVWDSVGTDDTTVVSGVSFPAGTPDDTGIPGVPAGSHYYIRRNHTAQTIVNYAGGSGAAGTSPWTTTSPTGGAGHPYAPLNIVVKTRSWLPPQSTLTTSVGSQTLPTPTPGSPNPTFTFNVASTAGFPSAGIFSVMGRVVSYSGTTSTTFTGCKGAGILTIPAGSAVTIPETAWSVEVQIPLKKHIAVGEFGDVGGGDDWMDLNDKFGIYMSVVRIGRTAASGSNPVEGLFATQFLFPLGTSNFLTGFLDETLDIPATWYGSGLIPSFQVPPGSNLGLGVNFVNGEFGVGVRDVGAPANSAPGSTLSTPWSTAPFTFDNRLVAQVHNTGATNADQVTAEFRFANWGLGPAGFAAWTGPVNTSTTNPSPAQTIPAGGATVELTVDWPRANVPNAYQPPHDHQCVWVQLDATGGSNVNFNQSSVRRNMDFKQFSTVSEPATISGVGYTGPTKGTDHEFILMTNSRIIQLGGEGKRQGFLPQPNTAMTNVTPTQYWLWIVHGYRKTGKTLDIRGEKFDVLDFAPGNFGYIGIHDNVSDVIKERFSGGGIRALGNGFYALDVPDGGEVTINTTVSIEPVIVANKPCDDNPSDPWWLRLLKWLCRLIMKLFNLT